MNDLLRGRIINRLRVGFLGVLPEYQHTGVAAALYLEHFNTAARSRQKTGEASFILYVRVQAPTALEALIREIRRRAKATTTTTVVLQTFYEERPHPLPRDG